MTSLTIRGLDASLDARLRVRGEGHGRSMEEEARDILGSAPGGEAGGEGGLGASIRERVGVLGGVELPAVVREPMRAPPTFEE